MKNTIKTLTFAAAMVLSLSAGATDAFAKEAKHGRETAWTDLEPVAPVEEFLTEGVTWEE
jgi:post-segregation antitoxin (ccd killing protein)